MADEIGQLGLNTEPAVKSLDRFFKKVDETSAHAKQAAKELEKAEKAAYNFGYTIGTKVTNAIGKFGKALLGLVGIGSFVSVVGKIQNAMEEAEKLNAEIAKIGVDRGNPTFRTLDELESRLKRINTVLEKLQGGPSKGIGGAVNDASSVIGQMIDNVFNYAANGDYFNALNSAFDPSFAARQIGSQNQSNIKTLEEEKEKAQAAITAKEIAAERIKIEREAMKRRTDDKLKEDERANKQMVDSFKKSQKEYDDMREKAHQDQIDFEKQIADENKRHDEEKAERLQKEKELLEEIRKVNRENTEELQKQNQINDILDDTGNAQQAIKQDIRNDYAKQIAEAEGRGSTDEAAELRKARDRKLADQDAIEAGKTPRERSNERKAKRKRDRDEASGKARNRDLDDRIRRGARGDEGSSLEQRRDELDRIDKADKTAPISPDAQGYGDTDRKILRNILEQLTPKS